MSFYGFHTTTRAERELLLGKDGKKIVVQPEWLQRQVQGNKPVVIEEGTGKMYIHKPDSFLQLLKDLDNDRYDPVHSEYYKQYGYKGPDITTRLDNLPALYQQIKENGITSPLEVECTGERIDGSFRSKIALHLGLKDLPAIEHRFKWEDVSPDFIQRKLTARNMSCSPDYYYFAYNNKWTNAENTGRVHKENAERWDLFKDLVGDSIVDVGCNEAYVSLQLARLGKKVWGVDHDHIHLANLNRLIFEFVDQKDLDAEFVEDDILKVNYPESDTVLLLNVLYHIPRDKQAELLNKFRGRKLIFQCNLRKEQERETYWTSHPEDLKTMLKDNKFDIIKEITWRDKPIIVCR